MAITDPLEIAGFIAQVISGVFQGLVSGWFGPYTFLQVLLGVTVFEMITAVIGYLLWGALSSEGRSQARGALFGKRKKED